ncbi:MAG: Sec-independent factor for membrane protein insertion (YidC/SpoIIIJ family) [Candidatus Moranbacteria bacterium GW2011_GWE1_36_7]|nr:MAG: Sec-independent factor for membrane protein insertion (YidC/SpoIIIJ family) [Candidatus Moranbacteria bacterium GW2011_GWD2_36_12]KKQ06382.1 MAG: Sec-independent factor for membrane protein insertion (YidC/SpoIIIJ family) [Candidatus Moranbacteria bacterium GW2011_GWE2_36_40]KKQ14822.1 MAG: Sec-independent factor for membrane protein insertion (YidC/SpoIIIJ family) [Candidatus Moranbacteria bacterium GW2011_GWE1_36_7]
MLSFFHTTVYQPLYNILIFFYNIVPGGDFGVSIILITILLRTILIPLYKKQIESQKKLQELQPKIKELQEKTKNNKEQQTKQLMELYKEHKTNPFSGCLPLIVQLIFLIAIYQVLITISNNGLVADPSQLYSFVSDPGKINQFFIFLVDLTKPSIIIAALAAIAQYFQTKMLMDKSSTAIDSSGHVLNKLHDEKNPDFANIMTKQMLYLGPIMTLFIGIKFPAGLSLYWLAGTLFMLIQQILMEKKSKN